MTVAVLIGLAVMWAVVLLGGWVSSIKERGGRGTSIDNFSQQLNALSSTSNVPVPAGNPPGARLSPALRFSSHRRPRSAVPGSAKEAFQRRRDIVVLLAVCALATLLGWFVSKQTGVLVAHAVFDAALLGYTFLIFQRRQLEAERMAKVHYLHSAPGPVEDQPLRRSAES